MNKKRTDLLHRLISRASRKPRGQSFVELMLVVLVLALILSGVVEFGFLLNNYLHVLDAAREAARYSSNQIAFLWDDSTSPATLVESAPFYFNSAAKASTIMQPVALDPTHPDDIVISVFSVSGGSSTIVRFPPANPNGWSLCAHYASFKSYFLNMIPPQPIPEGLRAAGWNSGCTVRTSKLTNADVVARMDASAPNSGVLVVEIFYNYPQLLKLPVITQMLADPVALYIYTVMPLSSAEPTQVP